MDLELRDGLWWRLCNLCHNPTSHTLRNNALKAIRKNQKCKDCAKKPENTVGYGRTGSLNPFYGKKHTEITKKKLSEQDKSYAKTESFRLKMQDVMNNRISNGETRKSNYQYNVDKYGKEEADRRAKDFSLKQSINNSGSSNPMFGKTTPGSSGYGWKGWIDGTFFRSLRELRFILDNPDYESAESNMWRAYYVFNNSERSTVADFINHQCRELVECKPKRLINTKLVSTKTKALSEMAKVKGYSFRIFDPGIVEKEELLKLLKCGRLKLMNKYAERLKEW